MAVSAEQFTKPEGLVEPRSMFPGESEADLLARIEAYIDEGTTRSADVATDSVDNAVTAWTYYRIFLAVWLEMSANPSSAAMADQGSKLYTSYQINNFKELADQYLAEFNGLIATEIPTTTLRSYSVSHKINYR